MVTPTTRVRSAPAILFLLGVFVFLTGAARLPAWAGTGAVQSGGVVLLTFDTEVDPDAMALREMRLDVPATYFFTGAYAEAHPGLLRELAAQGNTIGSHSYKHDHMTQLDADGVRMDLRLAKMVIEKETGQPVKWFRAPYIEYDDTIMRTATELGLQYDSSDIDYWPKNNFMPELDHLFQGSSGF